MIQILYTCKTCGVTDAKLTVPHRKENEDIKLYVEDLGRRMYHDHWAKHPGCTTLLDMKIPLQEGAEKIGYAPKEAER